MGNVKRNVGLGRLSQVAHKRPPWDSTTRPSLGYTDCC
jgi:hypothetical protein